MTQDTAVSNAPRRSIIAREALAHLAAALLFPFGVRDTRARTPRRKEQHTIVLIHGYLSNRSSLLPLAAYLRWTTESKVLTFNYRWNWGAEQAARELRTFLRRRVRGGRIDLIGHSLGGLIARLYLQQLGGARRVDRCLTLGTPHEGTYNAYWVASRVGDDLRPDSRFLQRLNDRRHSSGGVRYTAIVGGSDNIVLPRGFASKGEDVVVVPNLGHLGMLFSPAVFREVAARLRRTT